MLAEERADVAERVADKQGQRMHELMNHNDQLQMQISTLKESKDSEVARGNEAFYNEIQAIREESRKKIDKIELEAREQCRQVREDREY